MPTLSITVSAATAQRIVSAFGKKLNTEDHTDPLNPVPRDATEEEVRQQIMDFVRVIVLAHERLAAINDIEAVAVEIT